MATTTQLLTTDEYLLLNHGSRPTELIRGVVVDMNLPGFRHGKTCVRIVNFLTDLNRQFRLGHVVSNDTGIITEHDPDTVRGADVAFYSFAIIPPHEEPAGYPGVVPELVYEVLSPSDRSGDVHSKVGEYLNVGVQIVVVVDPERREVQVYRQDRSVQVLSDKDVVSLVELHAGFEFSVVSILEDAA